MQFSRQQPLDASPGKECGQIDRTHTGCEMVATGDAVSHGLKCETQPQEITWARRT
jgi:hypothetical protein